MEGGLTQWPSGIAMLDDARGSALLTAAGFAYPPAGTGLIRMFIYDGSNAPLAGATVALAGVVNPPVYLDGSGAPDVHLTATSASGEVLFGNVDPGPFGIVVAATGKTCALDPYGWTGSGSAAASVVVDAATLTDDVGASAAR